MEITKASHTGEARSIDLFGAAGFTWYGEGRDQQNSRQVAEWNGDEHEWDN
jgi:hypothetical protein